MKYLVLIHLDEYVTEEPPAALLDAMIAHVADETHARVVTDAGLAPTTASIRVTPRGALCKSDEIVVGRTFLLLNPLKQRFDRLCKLSDPVKADDGQRTLYLVQVCAAESKLRQVSGSLTDPE